LSLTASVGIVKFDDCRFIKLGDAFHSELRSPEGVADTDCDRRVLIAVAPALLGELLARALDREDLEIVLVDDPRAVTDERAFDVVVTSGLPPVGVATATIVQLPDRIRGDDVGSLVTPLGVERIRIPEVSSVVVLVHELCARDRSEPR
jgi:hypothetical protein